MAIFTSRTLFALKILSGATIIALAGNAYAQEVGIDLGDVAPGSVRPLKLIAKNANCEAPQDFRIELSDDPWFRMSGPTVMSGIPAGGSQSSELLMDFANMSPGRYKGAVEINCETCGWWIFTACTANDQTVEIEFRIPKPSARNPGRYDTFMDAMSDVANGNVNVQLGPPQWIEWDDNNDGFVFPPGQAPHDLRTQGENPDNQNQTFDLPEGFVIWFDNDIPHVGEPEDFPYPPSPIGGDARYPSDAEFGGITWDEREPRIGIGLRYTQDDENQPKAPGDKNDDGIADGKESRIGIGARYTQDDLDNPPPPPTQGEPKPKPSVIFDRNGDGNVDDTDAAILLMEAWMEAYYGVPIKFLRPGGAGQRPPKGPKSPARFVEGDLNGDGKFDNADLIKGLEQGGFGPPIVLPRPDGKGVEDIDWLEELKGGNPVILPNPFPKDDKDDKTAEDRNWLENIIGPPIILPNPHGKNEDGLAGESKDDEDLGKDFQDYIDRLYLEELLKLLEKDLVPLPPWSPKGSGDKPKPKPKAVIFHPPVDFENDMTGRDLKKLREKRLECIKKTAAVAGAQSDLSDKAKKATDCAKKLAALKAALDKAKAEEAGAEKAAKDTAAHAANYKADLDAAQKAARKAMKTLEMQAAAHMSLVREKDAGNPQPSAEAHAKDQSSKAGDAVNAANRNTGAVKNSKKARDSAARNAAKAAKAAAKKAKDAQKAYDKQKALCDPLITAAKVAKSKVTIAETALEACKAKLKAAEASAPGQAVSNLQGKLDKAMGRKAGCERDMDKYARELGQAFKALRLLGVLRPPKEKLKTERQLNDSQEFYGALFATGAAKAANVATFEVFAALDALKAGYGIYKIKNSSLTPSSSRFVRSELNDWLTKTKGIADNPIEAEAVIKIMEGIINRNGKTDHIRKNWQRMERQCKQNDDDIKRLRDRISKAPK